MRAGSYLYLLLFLLIQTVCSSGTAIANSCIHKRAFVPIEDAYLLADVVFSGIAHTGHNPDEPRFTVTRWYKLSHSYQLHKSEVTLFSPINRFQTGKEYIVFAAVEPANSETIRLTDLPCLGATGMSPSAALSEMKALEVASPSVKAALPYHLAAKGRVVEVRHTAIGPEKHFQVSSAIVFDIEDTFKADHFIGPPSRETSRTTLFALQCGELFRPGHDYIVLANPGWSTIGTESKRIYGYRLSCTPPDHVIDMDETRILDALHADFSQKE